MCVESHEEIIADRVENRKKQKEIILEKLESSDKVIVSRLAVLAADAYKDFLSFCSDKDLVIEFEGEDALIITKSAYWTSAEKYQDWR
ncbi:hypothetical protein LCGC14_2930080 [marine sediment metagenome]|uniref:Uncharacterized protein n=1 Tax=marine sediment metagenome TaxID=412755 RepID=A0A0F8XLJ9_9ZZZZ